MAELRQATETGSGTVAGYGSTLLVASQLDSGHTGSAAKQPSFLYAVGSGTVAAGAAALPALADIDIPAGVRRGAAGWAVGSAIGAFSTAPR